MARPAVKRASRIREYPGRPGRIRSGTGAFAASDVEGAEGSEFVDITAEASTEWFPADALVSAGGMVRPYVTFVDASNARNGDNRSSAA
ncbi:hypothetical protein GCM10009548_91690 [Streptomyces malaysiensis subsp. malaysiensis]